MASQKIAGALLYRRLHLSRLGSNHQNHELTRSNLIVMQSARSRITNSTKWNYGYFFTCQGLFLPYTCAFPNNPKFKVLESLEITRKWPYGLSMQWLKPGKWAKKSKLAFSIGFLKNNLDKKKRREVKTFLKHKKSSKGSQNVPLFSMYDVMWSSDVFNGFKSQKVCRSHTFEVRYGYSFSYMIAKTA